jgi:hypothetical protein
MSCNPATGAQTSHFYVAETVCGVTPTSPAWKPLRFTGGNMRLTKDSLQSQMLDGSREVADIRLGSNQTAGEISVELAYADQFDLLEAALGGTWSAPANLTGLTLDVSATNSTFTRSAGSFITDGILIGDLIRFTGLVNAVNNAIYQVTNVAALVVTVRAVAGTLVDETAVTSCGAVKARKLSVGAERRTFSVLTHFADADDGDGEYHITTGVEITGYSFNVAVNALVTGTLSTIGRAYQPDVALPGGSTFPATAKRTVYSNVDGIIMDTSVTPAVRIGLATSMDLSLDNAASAQFEIGSNDVSFIERGRADSKLSLSTFFETSAMLNKFINETETAVSIAMFSDEGAMAFNYPRVVYTSGAPEVAGPASIVQTLEAQALAGKDGTSSISVQYLPVAS